MELAFAQGLPAQLDEMLVVDYIRSYETRARNCAKEIEAAFKDKSLPGLDW